MPILYIPHGGGPLPLMNDVNHKGLIKFLTTIIHELPQPKAIIVITAHWEESEVTISSNPTPGMLFDYSGFPPQTYQYAYPAKGDPALAKRIQYTLEQQGVSTSLDDQRGFDHGTFVPLMLMYPDAALPVIQVSLQKDLDPRLHINVGKALAEFSTQGMLILGSGSSFHNMRISEALTAKAPTMSQEFNQWLNNTITGEASWEEKADALSRWEEAPHGKFAHPREEHLLPLHVCFGAAQALQLSVKNVFNQPFYGIHVSAFLWR